MKKIAIVTITNSGMNFGNRLQNYALQHVLESYSADVRTIYSSKSVRSSLFLSRVRRNAKMILKSCGRRRNFNLFDKKHIKKAKQIRYEHINENIFNKKFDVFIAGSDQIWNPEFHFNSGFEFLTFADPQKRYSYSASFGLEDIPDKHKKDYAEWLKSMRSISVREKQGCEIVKKLTGRDAFLHIDPTMLLDAEHYAQMEEKPSAKLPEKYLLMYFLGEKKPEYTAFTEGIAKKTGLPVLELSESAGSPLYNIGPQHFLYLLRHAEYICTDSFHGTIFAAIFQRRFTVFYRSDRNSPMNSRIDTLLEKLRLQVRLYSALDIEDYVGDMNYAEVDRLVADERASAHDYLRGIVGSDD